MRLVNQAKNNAELEPNLFILLTSSSSYRYQAFSISCSVIRLRSNQWKLLPLDLNSASLENWFRNQRRRFSWYHEHRPQFIQHFQLMNKCSVSVFIFQLEYSILLVAVPKGKAACCVAYIFCFFVVFCKLTLVLADALDIHVTCELYNLRFIKA